MKRHDSDAISLVFGSVFLGVVVWWSLAKLAGIDPPRMSWFLAGALIVVGLLGVLAALRPTIVRPRGRGDASR
jgi:hypothetical protein